MAAQFGGIDFAALNQRYAAEKDKRIRPDGNAQYIDIETDDKWKSLAKDPWANPIELASRPPVLKSGDEVKIIILGAGYGGLLYAVRFIQAGFKPSNIRIVDTAGGFGGTWYWNRYPGLMCDVESYVYMPLLEETGYMPKHKYSYGPELRAYAELIAEKWDLTDKAVFCTEVRSYEWEESSKRWVVKLEQQRGGDMVDMTVRSQFVVIANGVLNHPKIPKGLENFGAHVFHTARWDYGPTGGSPENPTLTGLEGKRVGLIGTGATSIQLVPQLAKWAKELYVFQRTPSSVGERGQRETTPEEWKKIANGPGWQLRRSENFMAWLSGETPDENMVNDEWSKMKGYCALVGGPHDKPLTMEDIPGHIGKYMALDYEHSEGTRQRVDVIVKDEKTAASLKAWYPSWCKRPTFHDDYLPSFNLPNVHLVDTDGKGIDRSSKSGIIAAGKEYPLDVLILSTGYRSPAAELMEPGAASNMTIVGRDSVPLAEKWNTKGPSTLHGITTNGFPNLFLAGPAQTGASANFVYVQDVLSQHSAYLAAEAIKQSLDPERATVEPTVEAEEGWSMQIMMRAAWFATIGVCTPSYINQEGQMQMDQAETMKLMRGSPYSLGMNAYTYVLREWRADGKMDGIIISP
jgi:cation diffusion facilitator CzcD-associated flavoprotein CzcO